MRMTQEMDDDEKGKLFVGGLSWETSQENLQRYFSRYGDVIDCVVMKNSDSGRSRGFGFVTFAEPSLVNVVLQNGPHQLDGRTIDPKPCNPRTLQKPKRGGGYPKVFLGGLPSNITETDLRVFFGRYGKVMEVVIMYDQEKKKSRGFGFLSFEEEHSVERVTQEHFINLNGKQVEIKRAEPRDGSVKLGGGVGMGGGGMGGGGPGDGSGGGGGGQWGPPAGAPISMMQGHNGQMGGPPINMPMAGPNIMQGYQGWGTSPGQTSYAGYGAAAAAAAGAAAPGSYQGWGAPPGPQAPPPHAAQWQPTSNYQQHAAPPQTQGYGSYVRALLVLPVREPGTTGTCPRTPTLLDQVVRCTVVAAAVAAADRERPARSAAPYRRREAEPPLVANLHRRPQLPTTAPSSSTRRQLMLSRIRARRTAAVAERARPMQRRTATRRHRTTISQRMIMSTQALPETDTKDHRSEVITTRQPVVRAAHPHTIPIDANSYIY